MGDHLSILTFNAFTPQILGEFLILAVLLTISAFISGSETAFFSLSPNDVGKLKKSETRTSKAAIKLLEAQDYLLATILITNNLVNICAVILSNSIIDKLVVFPGSGATEFAVKVILVTFLLLLFGEIMPKIFATQNALKFTKITSVPLLFIKGVLKPFSFVLIRSSSHINESVAVKKVNISMDELSNAIEITSDQTVEEKKILSGIVNFISTEVVEVMRPRVDIIALDHEEGFDAVRHTVMESGFSRIPVYEDSLDNIKGILYIKDLMSHIDADNDFDWYRLIRPPYFIPEHKKINDLFVDFQNNKIHIAVVVDEYGSTMGLVSLEDILEEIVGEISDESDINEAYYTKIDSNTYVFEGKTHINDFLKVLNLDDDYLDDIKGDAESIAGIMIEMKRDFLKKGDSVIYRNLSLYVESVNGRRIDKVKVFIDRNE